MPVIDFILQPGDSLELTVNIRVSADKVENHVEQYVFEFYTDKHGQFGQVLEATIEVEAGELRQEEALMHILQDQNVNESDPEVIKAAEDLVLEGIGSKEECI